MTPRCALNPAFLIGLALALAHCPMPLRAAAPPSPLAVERALTDLASGDWVLQWQALRQLADWKVATAEPQIRALLKADARPWVRGRALVALAELRGDQVLDEVLALTRNGTPDVRAAAVEALGIVGSERGQQAVADRLTDPAPMVRHQAVVALARLRGAHAWPTIAQQLATDDPAMVRYATRALAFVPTPDATAKALELLGHDNVGVRAEAAATLAKARPPKAIDPLLTHMASDPDTQVRTASRKALTAFEPVALATPLLAALHDDDTRRRSAALAILALRPTTATAAAVVALVAEPDERTTRVLPQALDVLARLDARRHVGLFARFRSHEHREVRRAAVACIARCPDADLFALLKPCLADADSRVRSLAFGAIRARTDGAPPEGIVAYLAKPLAAADRSTLRAALHLARARLTRAELSPAIATLTPLLAHADRECRTLAASALERICDDDGRRRIAQAQGYLTDWMLIGPFPSDRDNKGLATVYPPEQAIDFAKPIAVDLTPGKPHNLAWEPWRVTTIDGKLPLHAIIAPPIGLKVAYAVADIRSPADRAAHLWVEADDGFVLWLNGAKVADRPTRGTHEADVPLRRGPNRLLVKVANLAEWWFVRIRVTDRQGRPLHLHAAP